jgi:hypothetical protein
MVFLKIQKIYLFVASASLIVKDVSRINRIVWSVYRLEPENKIFQSVLV